ncbi:MAG TPA: choice-of-anchor L domain-containing protein [Polyangia bacterium]|nr:choice-of-anchor L domain-containing protein [Polyangia bacterium]
MKRAPGFLLLALLAAVAAGCRSMAAPFDIDTGDDDDGTTDGDADGDGDTDTDADGDADTDSGSDTAGPIVPDCSACEGLVGGTLEAMRCAVDLCDDEVLVSQEYVSLSASPASGTASAVQRFGAVTNALAPVLNDTYALMASGPAEGTSHSQGMGGTPAEDPFTADGVAINDVYEWRLTLKAPPGAHGFSVAYVFFSEEYDEYIGASYNDRFYIIVESSETSDGQPTVINHGPCRAEGGSPDFTGADCDEPDGQCCFISPKSDFSECCWFGGCPDGTFATDISGTGFECAPTQQSDSSTTGSSTGWLRTSWPIVPGEQFRLTFHIHDSGDGIFDSEVILDSLLFIGQVEPGTVRIE